MNLVEMLIHPFHTNQKGYMLTKPTTWLSCQLYPHISGYAKCVIVNPKSRKCIKNRKCRKSTKSRKIRKIRKGKKSRKKGILWKVGKVRNVCKTEMSPKLKWH